MSIADTRFDQLFPVLNSAQIDTAKRFASGEARRFAPGELAYDVGMRNASAWLVLSGGLEVMRRDGLHRQTSVVLLTEGQFSGEVSQLAGRGTLAAAQGGPRRLHGAAVRRRAHPRAGDRLGRTRRDRHARLHPAPRRADPGGRRRLAAGRPARLARSGAAARFSLAQCLSLYGARRRLRRGGARGGGAFRRAAGRTAADDLPQRLVPEAAERRRSRHVPRHHAGARSRHRL